MWQITVAFFVGVIIGIVILGLLVGGRIADNLREDARDE
jgi:hypothetical protein